MGDFTKLRVWEKAHAMAVQVHDLASRIRPGYLGSLRNQLIRSAMSVPTNIVEGSGQRSKREFTRFLRIAVNSSRELEYHLMLATEVNAIAEDDFRAVRAKVIEVRKMLYGMIKRFDRPDAS